MKHLMHISCADVNARGSLESECWWLLHTMYLTTLWLYVIGYFGDCYNYLVWRSLLNGGNLGRKRFDKLNYCNETILEITVQHLNSVNSLERHIFFHNSVQGHTCGHRTENTWAQRSSDVTFCPYSAHTCNNFWNTDYCLDQIRNIISWLMENLINNC